ncbi:MAG: ribosomal L7Ae/L30e/S12e/Gadd45 family protein [Clostridia bacterium]|nr:ribosomal L7Ae/L30e/S12e/Gadd45 family protein [Clostridia bacterium]
MKTNKYLLMLGLCKRAGALTVGVPLTVKAIQEKKAITVFYSVDASANAEKKITDKCTFYGVPCHKTEYTSEQLGRAVGKTGAVCALCITDKSFSDELTNLNLNEKR